jgi:glycosyltransferase involved in cell wall biosynthesis
VVALSAGASSTLKDHYWLGARPPVTVIPNAVPRDRFRSPTSEERAAARASLGVPADAEVILVIGALTPEKGVDLAISAARGVQGGSLVVAGDGPLRAELEALASRWLPDRSFFIGALSDPRVAYWAADLLVLPSRSESMPAVLIEAGLCGLASVATDVGETGEIVDEGRTGVLVASGDAAAMSAAVSGLVSDQKRRLAMGLAAAERCSERFTIDRTVSTWFDLLAGLSATPCEFAG